MNAQYDPRILLEYSNELYRQAAGIVWTAAVWGVLVGGGIFAGFDLMRSGTFGPIALVPALIGGMVGYRIGQGKAFRLRLEAQRTLLQLQIEFNTRPRN